MLTILIILCLALLLAGASLGLNYLVLREWWAAYFEMRHRLLSDRRYHRLLTPKQVGPV